MTTLMLAVWIVSAAAAAADDPTRVLVEVPQPAYVVCRFPPPIEIDVPPVVIPLPAFFTPSAITIQPPPVSYQPPCQDVTIQPPPLTYYEVRTSACSAAAIEAALALAEKGERVRVQGPCESEWTSTVTLRGRSLIAEGEVTIRHNAGAAPVFTLERDQDAQTELAGFEFRPGSNVGSDAAFVELTGPGPLAAGGFHPIIVHRNDFLTDGRQGRSILARLVGGAIIHSNQFAASGVDAAITVKCESVACDASWSTPPTRGTLDEVGLSNVYVEDNVFKGYINASVVDADSNARVVIRHNQMLHSHVASHGADSSQDGVRHVEVYRNEFTFTSDGRCSSPSTTPNLNWFIYIRGGSWDIFENTLPNIQSCIWGSKPEIAITVQNLRRSGGPYGCWSGGYPAPRQAGQGHDGQQFIVDPIYIWGNNGSGNETPTLLNYSPDQCGGGPAIGQFVQAGRDFIVGTPRPDYTPFVYPHPLREE